MNRIEARDYRIKLNELGQLDDEYVLMDLYFKAQQTLFELGEIAKLTMTISEFGIYLEVDSEGERNTFDGDLESMIALRDICSDNSGIIESIMLS